ncbi:hypothetical protein A2526_01055 [candidate division WOR-1 bacterium RIFOXYD2_FULL_36_8]|uniref:DUF4258 domain-containing protein n=1 Tax=candidate division WOR-1 bacterium RIFOXYB2_FULL_36_35 TaxID=1802578 RepID=A0A1F4S2P8_UNCSA|nr:MAG: hypothetical protein A2230_07670 [candidate division WOR-1 bacterium RIFOXYA2_FULL_36_21]OGC14736.1 MAG: hypothetical protein A2290_08575 [candidate division WOR-1 bacterium RIFOXYB2_FULL_36_35]OGC21258.1 MAG: hypothetical protein A2282_01890 [candidate division WOR-1 bacterium RIFOXYA12_FULL_36_13]OGC38044.1 MAG: hypothetical protein A2526_01055 [candidate division WOR-1 bacterium RIFOXYD2_FULL_36_8]
MEIEFSPHAKRQLKEREINFKKVEKSLKKPDEIVNGSLHGRKIAHKIFKIKNKIFLYRIVFIKESLKYFIITVYRTTKIQKYFKGEKLK